MKRIALTVLIAFCTVVFTFHPTHAQTTDAELRAALLQQIAELQALIATLTAQMTPTTYQFTKADWGSVGAKGESYRQLQRALNSLGYTVAQTGPGAPGSETDYFGPATETALKRFQTDHGIVSFGTPATTGYGALGPKTAEQLNAALKAKPATTPTATPTTPATTDDEDKEETEEEEEDDNRSGGGGGSSSSDADTEEEENTPAPTDTTAPTLSNGGPSGTLSSGTTNATLSVTTNENATCRYGSSAGQSYTNLSQTMTGDGGTSHTASLSVSEGNSYTRYIRCRDAAGNTTSADFTVAFNVAAAPEPEPDPEVGGDPYDLGDVPFSISWPTSPNTDQTINVSNLSEFQAAVEQSNVRVVVAPGDYTGNLDVRGDDIAIEMSNNANLYGSVNIAFNNERISWTGGNVNTAQTTGSTGRIHVRGVRDLLLDDMYIVGTVEVIGDASQRVAMINTSVDADTVTDFGVFMSPTSGGGRNSDIIYANVRFDSPLGTDNGTNRNQYTDRMVVVDSTFNMEGHLSTGFRVGEMTDQLYVRDTMIAGRVFHSYNENGNINVTNAVYENVTRYTVPSENVSNRFASFNAGIANTGTVDNSQLYGFDAGTAGEPLNLGQFTVPPGGSNPSILSWSGDNADLPDVSDYGAARYPSF